MSEEQLMESTAALSYVFHWSYCAISSMCTICVCACVEIVANYYVDKGYFWG